MTYVNDPIGDLLTRMRNAQHARRKSCRAPHSNIKVELCQLLKREGWIEDIEIVGEAPKQEIEVTFSKEKPVLSIRRVSTPGRRYYTGAQEIKKVENGFGIAVITTSQGLMTDREARKKHIGGEILCTIS